MGFRDFCTTHVFLRGKPISFDGRAYLDAIYGSQARHTVLRTSRQVEKTTLLANRIVYDVVRHPGRRVLFVCPRREQAQLFSNSRLLPTIEGSPLIRRYLLGGARCRIQVMNMTFANGSEVHIRAAYQSADSSRGVSVDELFLDEFQDLAPGCLPVLQETMSHSELKRVWIAGTPKLIDNHLEQVFALSTGNEWKVPCEKCQSEFVLNERVIALEGLTCPQCKSALDSRAGHWVPRNPGTKWGEGFSINHLMIPWMSIEEVLERQMTYDPAQFKNECLGLPTALGEHVITREELLACCTNRPMAKSWSDVKKVANIIMVAGVDWGGGSHSRTVITVGYPAEDGKFHICFLQHLHAHEEPNKVLEMVASICRQFRVSFVAADGGGNGHVYNRLLAGKLHGFADIFSIHYSSAESEPVPDGVLWKWTVNRSRAIGSVFARFKEKLNLLPRVQDCESFLDEFTCVVAEYDDYKRNIKFRHPETQFDDALHATTYAQLVAVRTIRKLSRFA